MWLSEEKPPVNNWCGRTAVCLMTSSSVRFLKFIDILCFCFCEGFFHVALFLWEGINPFS